MTFGEGLDKIYGSIKTFDEEIMMNSFIKDGFLETLFDALGLGSDDEKVAIAEEFFNIAKETFRWDDYYVATTTAEESIGKLIDKHPVLESQRDEIINLFTVAFFYEMLAVAEDIAKQEDYQGELPELEDDDIDCMEFAESLIGGRYTEEDNAFLSTIGVRWKYEQLHMICWFSRQTTFGAGHYSRTIPNHSSRITYNRLSDPFSLMWIAYLYGADEDDLRKAAEEIKGKKTGAAMCGVVRKYFPFDFILDSYRETKEQ